MVERVLRDSDHHFYLWGVYERTGLDNVQNGSRA